MNDTLTTSTEAAIAKAIEDGCTVWSRGKNRFVAITPEGKPLFLGGALTDPTREWDVMSPVGIALDEV